MRLSLILVLLITLVACSTAKQKVDEIPSKQLKISWTIEEGIKTPESTYYHPNTNLIFVSNIDGAPTDKNSSGYISLVSGKGKMLKPKWISGLNAPKGIRSFKNHLYLSDIDQIIKVNINKGIVEKKYKVQGAKFLNDVAIATNGDVYVSDMLTSKIHKLSNGMVTTFMEGAHLESPNGLFYHEGFLYVASWGLTTDFSTETPGRLYKVNLANKKITYITKNPLGNLDGLERDDQGNFYISDWKNGKVFKVKPSGETTLAYQGPAGLADIGYHKKRKTILAPLMNTNKVIELE